MREVVSFLGERRLKVKDGMHKTLVRQMDSVTSTLTVCEIGTSIPFGNFTKWETSVMVEMSKEGQKTMWYIALVSNPRESVGWPCIVCMWIRK